MYYIDIFNALNENKVRYLVVGALAMNLHGVPRMTSDMDIMIDLTPANIGRLIAAVEGLGFTPKIPQLAMSYLADADKLRSLKEEKGMLVFTLYNPAKQFQELDVFVENPIDFKAAYKKKYVFKAGGLSVTTISLDDLISIKELSPRKQDASDAAMLRKLYKV